MPNPKQSEQARNKASSQRHWDEVEQHLTRVEKTQGFATAWTLREQFELGKITLSDVKPH